MLPGKKTLRRKKEPLLQPSPGAVIKGFGVFEKRGSTFIIWTIKGGGFRAETQKRPRQCIAELITVRTTLQLFQGEGSLA